MNTETLQIGFNRCLLALENGAKKIGKWFSRVFLHPGQAMKTWYGIMVVCFFCFIFTWVRYDATVPLGGDYSMQSMTFIFDAYDDWHTFFRTGNFPQWDRTIFLGVDNVGANAFYFLFNPYLLILLPFPRSWLLQLQGLEYFVKMSVAGMFMYWYLGDLKLSPKSRSLGALTYAFCAYSFSYMWFHFIESVSFFPLILLGVERIVQKKDPRIFLVAFFLQGLTNYFFFVEFMIGSFLYAMFRFFQTMKSRSYDSNWGVLGMGILSYVTAILLGCLTLLPGMSMALSMPRVSNASYLQTILNAEGLKAKIDAIFTYKYGTEQNQVTPLLNFLFMSDDCYSSNLLNVYWYDNQVAGLYVTTPMLLMFFVSLMDSFHEKRWSYVIACFVLTFLVFTPFGFYLFSGFTVAYARWFIMPTAWMIVFDLKAVERRREIPRSYLDLSLVFTSVLMAISCFLIVLTVNKHPDYFSSTDWDEKMLLIVLSIAWLFVCYFVMRPLFHKRQFSIAVYLLSALDIIVMANATIYGEGTSTIAFDSDIPEETKIVELLKESENNEDFYRIYNSTQSRNNPNINVREGYEGTAAFHSVYPFVAQNFLDRSRIPYSERNWSMGVHNHRYNMETFIGTKYYLVDRVDPTFVAYHNTYGTPYSYPRAARAVPSEYDVPYGYVDVSTLTEADMEKYGVHYSEELIKYLKSKSCSKTLYLNTDFIDFAFAYSTVINEDWLGTNLRYKSDSADVEYNAYEDLNEYPLLRYAILPNDDFVTFYNKSRYNTGFVNLNQGTVAIITNTNNKSIASQAERFKDALTTESAYKEGVSAPIEVWNANSGTGYTNNLKLTIYSAHWPSTDRYPSGEYATCDALNALDENCLDEYRKSHPWEYYNGIRPADDAFDFFTKKDSSGRMISDKGYRYSNSVLYNSKLLITPIDEAGNPTLLLPEANPEDPTTGGYISIDDTDNIEWRFFDKNDHLICYAQHSYSNYKRAHGYYVDRPVAKILGILKEGTKENPITLHAPTLYVQRNSDYQKAIDNLKENAATIVSRDDDNVVFKTSYTSSKFVVLNYPNSNGWKLYRVTTDSNTGKEKKTEVKTYTAQGGFIGFEGKSGDVTYSLEYNSPFLKVGMMFTSLGLMITFACLVVFERRNRRINGNKDIESLKPVAEKDAEMRKYRYVNYEENIY